MFIIQKKDDMDQLQTFFIVLGYGHEYYNFLSNANCCFAQGECL